MKKRLDTETHCHCGKEYDSSDHCDHCFCEQYESTGCTDVYAPHAKMAEAIVAERFPNRHKFKIDWLRFEQDIRDTLQLKIDDIDKLYVLDLLLSEHTGRGTELDEWKNFI